MRLASESAEDEETRLSRRQSRDRAKRAVQSSQATKNCRGSETAEARERIDGDRRKRRLGLLYRTFYHDASVTSLLKLYVSLIRPILEYACQVWSPHLVKDVEKLEKVQ